MSVFGPCLRSLEADGGSVFGPTSFRDYVEMHGLGSVGRTPDLISIDSHERLPSELRYADAMVLRLGAGAQGTGTQFAVVKLPGHLRDFFLFDDELFGTLQRSTFLSTASMRDLYGFQLLPAHSEVSLVNLALASGVMSYGLRLDAQGPLLPAARGHSTFTFRLKAHSSLTSDLEHVAGQVEIDALFVARRNDLETLFVVEAKAGAKNRSLAKHKLVYPVLALARHVPADMPIVPVYLSIVREDAGLLFRIAECTFPDPRAGTRSLDELAPGRCSNLLLPLHGRVDR